MKKLILIVSLLAMAALTACIKQADLGVIAPAAVKTATPA